MSEKLKLKNQLCHRFYTVSNAFTRAYRPLLSELGLTYPQYLVMMALWEQDGQTIADLLRHTRIDGGAMSLILKKLDSKGYVNIVTGEHDKRSRVVHLTSTGSQARQQAAAIPEQMLCKLDSLSQQELHQLYTLIDKLSDNLQKSICSHTDKA